MWLCDGHTLSPRCLCACVHWTIDVLFHRLIHENAIRIAACVAFLGCSLLGKPLHELQHLVGAGHCSHHVHSDAPQGKSRAVGCGQTCKDRLHSADFSSSEHRSKSLPEQHGSGHDIPGNSHHSHDCSVCQALYVSATSTDYFAVSLRPNACEIRDAIDSESMDASAPQSADARGPPRLA